MGLRIAIMTGGRNEEIRARYAYLGVQDIYLKCSVKIKTYEDFIGKYSLTDEEIIYVGDDIPDYEFPFDFPLGYILFSKVDELIKWFTEKENANGWFLGKYVDEDVPMVITITH
jgi:hypothetical protein